MRGGVLVDAGEVGAAHGLVLIEEEARAEDAAVVVQLLGLFKVLHGFIHAIVLFVEQGGVEPRRGVIGVELFGQAKFLPGARS